MSANINLPGPGTAAFFASAVAFYSAAIMKDSKPVMWALLSAGFFAFAVGSVVEYVDRTVKPETKRPENLRVLLIVAAAAVIGAVLLGFQAFLSLAQ
jgi:predicted PurR-regulated permease PerM